MKIESQDHRIDELLRGSTFVIPRFQRPYSWEAEHISSFWSDVLTNLGESYFIGSMVAYKVARSELAIVDGQQRLTTITIFLCAIRDAFKKIDKEDLALGLQAYIQQRDRSNEIVYVLKTETSFPYLQEEVLKDSPADVPIKIGREEEAIHRAFNTFKRNIDEKVSEFLSHREQTSEQNHLDAAKWLELLRDTIFDLNVIFVTLDNEDDAYLIFETLNTRGKDLALSDLLRNHFARHLRPKGGVDQTNLKWKEILDTIQTAPGNLDPDNFIVHSWQSRYDFVTKAKIFPKVKERIVKKNANGHLDRFVSDASHWRSIFDTDYAWSKSEKEVAKSLSALRIFRVVQPAPGILSLIRAYRDKIIRYKTLKNVISNIEKFHFSFNAITQSRSSGGISGMYSSLGRSIFACDDANEAGVAISELTEKLREREVASSEFDVGFEQVYFLNHATSQKALVQYILKKIADHEQQPTIGDTEDLTIEHLIPQSFLGDEYHEDTIGCLGNLILVDAKTNVELGDKPFSKKRDILIKAGYKLPEAFLEMNELSADAIWDNTSRISEIARNEVWKV